MAKTTTAITLAVGLAQRLIEDGSSGRVLIVDMDPQGDAARGLGVQVNGHCVSNVLLGDGDVDVLRENVLSADRAGEGGPARPNLFILPATDRLSVAKEDILTEFALLAARSMRRRSADNGSHLMYLLDQKLGLAKEVFDYILIDCPPTLDVLQQAIHQFADYAVVPVKVDFHGTSATGRHTQNILDDQAEGISIMIAAVVPTFVTARNNLTKSMMETLMKVYGRQVVTKGIPNTVRVAEAPASGGMTILEYMPSSPAAEAYADLVERIYTMR